MTSMSYLHCLSPKANHARVSINRSETKKCSMWPTNPPALHLGICSASWICSLRGCCPVKVLGLVLPGLARVCLVSWRPVLSLAHGTVVSGPGQCTPAVATTERSWGHPLSRPHATFSYALYIRILLTVDHHLKVIFCHGGQGRAALGLDFAL